MDTSGSVDHDMVRHFLSECRYLLESMHPEKMVIQTFDTRLHDRYEFTPGDFIDKMHISGRGGTRIEPVIESVKEENPEVVIVLTDGYFPNEDFTNTPGSWYWIIYDNADFEAPTGRAIQYNPPSN
jgi:predicted metal-dependent peptidase